MDISVVIISKLVGSFEFISTLSHRTFHSSMSYFIGSQSFKIFTKPLLLSKEPTMFIGRSLFCTCIGM